MLRLDFLSALKSFFILANLYLSLGLLIYSHFMLGQRFGEEYGEFTFLAAASYLRQTFSRPQ